MTLPANITLTQAGLTPSIEIIDGAIETPLEPPYASWLGTTIAAALAAVLPPTLDFSDPNNSILI